MGVRSAAIGAQSIQCGYAKRRSEVAVAATTCVHVLKLEANFFGQILGVLVQ